MKPLIILLACFTATTLISRLFFNNWNLPFAGNLAMCAMLFLTAAGHVLFTKGMILMIPLQLLFIGWVSDFSIERVNG